MLRGRGSLTPFSGGLCACVVFITSFFLGNSSVCLGSSVTNLNPGQTINLSDLVDTNLSGVEIGDKLFSDFTVSFSANNAFTPGDLQLTALSNQVGFGISFSGPMSALGNVTEDVVFRFSVAVTNSSQLISDVHLDYNGTVNGAGFSTVTETVFTGGFGGTLVGQINVFNLGGTNFQLSSAADLPTPEQKIYIEKDVIFGGGASGNQNASFISIIDQTFLQVPEPSTVLLSVAGLVILLFGMRQK
jgi:hypothetical protein